MRLSTPLAFCCGPWMAPVWAADQPTRVLPGTEGMLTTGLGLAFILILIFGAAWLAKRFGGLPAGGKGMVKVLGGASLGTRERVVVVQVDDTRLVLGVAPGRVQALHVLPPDVEFRRELEQAREQDG